MRLPLVFPLLGLVALASLVSSSSAPRASIDGVPPVFDIAESYIRSQTDGSAQPIGYNGVGNCSSKNPCILGSCCNSDGQCGYRPEHCSPSSPKTCVANCDAKAPCGEYSADGETSCPLNMCCSRFGFCGTSDVFCKDTATIAGADGAANDPSCGKNSGSASRRIAYYQSWNSRTRGCDKVWPDQLDLSGITHLVLAFATIDPKTFKVGMMDASDEEIYKKFLALPGSLSKWLGLGGFQFTDTGPTQRTFSEMTSSPENRKAFIDSLQQFLSQWKFSGVDIDWEWPGHPDRGGSSQDGDNQVQLFKEMRQAFGNNLGLGVVIPVQYDYMQHMDLKGLETQVDWLTILTYDLHGPWDATTQGLGPKIKPHTDLKEVDSALKPLWSSQIDSKKINMGIANYGRGYTVADKNCAYYGCAYTGPSKQGSCTSQPGVLSSCEIRRLIAEKGLSWKVIDGGAETNEVTWDDQWISWDDKGTLAKKLELANDRCLGGTALWAIDYDVCPSDGGSPQPGPPGSSAAPSQPASSMTSSFQPQWSASSGSPSASSQALWSAPSASPSASSQQSWSEPPESSQPASSSPPASSQASWSAPSASPSVSSQASWSTSSPSLSGPQGSSAGLSSDAPFLPVSSAHGSSQAVSSTSADASSAAPVWPVPSSGSSVAWSATPSSTPWSSSAPGSSIAGSSAASSTGSPASSGAAASSSSSNAWTVPATSDSASPSNAWTSPPSSSSGGWSSSQAASSSEASTTVQFGTSWAWSSSASASTGSSGESSQGWTSAGATSSGAAITTSSASPSSSSGATASASSSQDSSTPWNSWNNPSSSTSSAAQSASWGSSSAAQNSSGMFLSSAPPNSSAAASSGSSAAGSSAAQSSVQASAGQSSAQSSAAQSSGGHSPAPQTSKAAESSKTAETSKGAESSKGAGSSKGTTNTAPPLAQSTTTGVVAISSALPPSQWLCPDVCWNSDWCSHFCDGKELQWPPPWQCWHYDWCRLWWGYTDNKIDEKDSKKCKLLGCGCGWMGLPFGPGCPNKFPWFIQIIIDLFGLFPKPCLYWGCEDTCGIFGCFGYCFGEEGCIECPDSICKGKGPKTGPIPSGAIPTGPPEGKPPKKCEVKDYKTAIERFVFCNENVELSSGISATTISTWGASDTVSTVTSSSSSCSTLLDYTISGCNVIDHMETKTVSKTKSTTLSSDTPGPACTRAPLSLDDDEGNNIPADWDFSSSIFASNTTAIDSRTSASFMSSTSSGSSSDSASGSSSAVSSTKQMSSSFQIGTSTLPKPTQSPGLMDKNGQWNVTIHLWFEGKGAKIEWELYDPNKNKAGEYKMDPVNAKDDIHTYIESWHDRAEEHHMPFGVDAWFRSPVSIDDAVVQFEIQKPVPNCPKAKNVECKPNMETENDLETKMFTVDSCWQFCSKDRPQDQLVKPSDLNCDDMNDANWVQDGSAWKRDFNCYWKGF